MSMNKGSGAPKFKKGFGADFCCKKLWKRLRSHDYETRASAGLRSQKRLWLRTLEIAGFGSTALDAIHLGVDCGAGHWLLSTPVQL